MREEGGTSPLLFFGDIMKKRKPVKRNPIARALADPRFHQRIVKPKKSRKAELPKDRE